MKAQIKQSNHTQGELVHFRVNTPEFLKEVFECGARMGIFKHPANIFKNLLAQAAQRSIEINDAQLNKIVFDLGLYDFKPSDKDYSKV